MVFLFPVLITLISVAFTYYLFQRWLKFYHFSQLVNRLPGPLALPVLGNILTMKTDKCGFTRQLIEYNERYGKNGAFRLWLGPIPMIFLTKASTAETILTSNILIDKSALYQFAMTWLGTGLLTSTGVKWKARRKMLTPTFHFSILNNFVDVFNEQSKILLKQLDEAFETFESFDILPYIGRCALDIICETAMGVKIQAQTNRKSKYVQAVHEMSEIIVTYEQKPWFWLKPIFYFFGDGYKYDECLKILKDFTKNVITERSDQLQKVCQQDQGDEKNNKPRRLAFLDLLLSMKGEDRLTIEGIQEEVDTFMFEGHDTTTSGIGWTIFLLGHHPKVQEKIFEELESIFGDSNRDPTSEDLKAMKYLECVIKESLRLYPPVPWFGRKATEEFRAGDYTVPKDIDVNILPYCIHRDQSVYGEDANEFRPERFQLDAIIGRNPYSYVPFSAGPRNCIGQKFALMEEKVILSAIVRRYKIESIKKKEQVQEVFDLILRPFEGILIKIIPR